MPAWMDSDLVVCESNATIVRYLARQYGQEPLRPVSPTEWAQTPKWMDWASLSFTGPLRDWVWNMRRCPPEPRSEAVILRGEKECARLMQLAKTALQLVIWPASGHRHTTNVHAYRADTQAAAAALLAQSAYTSQRKWACVGWD